MNEKQSALLIVSVLVIWSVCGWIGCEIRQKMIDNFQSQAIHRGFAEYNPTNAVWQWKENTK